MNWGSTAAIVPKSGLPQRLGIQMDRLRTRHSELKHYDAHSGSLEAAGISFMLRWLLYSLLALVDAQAVLGAITKGCSSAPTLRFEVRRIALLGSLQDCFFEN